MRRMSPIETANIVMMILGVVLIGSSPIIIYRTVRGEKMRLRDNPEVKIQWFNSGLNIVIAVVFLVAGVFFIINNLRGNPLA